MVFQTPLNCVPLIQSLNTSKLSSLNLIFQTVGEEKKSQALMDDSV